MSALYYLYIEIMQQDNTCAQNDNVATIKNSV